MDFLGKLQIHRMCSEVETKTSLFSPYGLLSEFITTSNNGHLHKKRNGFGLFHFILSIIMQIWVEFYVKSYIAFCRIEFSRKEVSGQQLFKINNKDTRNVLIWYFVILKFGTDIPASNTKNGKKNHAPARKYMR